MRRYLQLVLSEWLATYLVVAAGTGAIAVNNLTHQLGHGGVAAAFGLVVVVIIYAFGDSSGAHANPAVTIGFWAAGRLPGPLVLPYLVAQCLGALAASASLARLLPAAVAQGLGGTHSLLPPRPTWLLEALLTATLMLLVLRVSVNAREKGITAALAVGALVALEALVAGPLTGASMNPARSLGPAVVSGQLAGLWVYLTAPVAGALAAVGLAHLLPAPPQSAD